MEISANNKRIAKNTLMLYIRMAFIMLVNLYTSRVILHALGVDDFGLYNIVGGVVVLFSFINNAMITSVQRFLNYELGRNNIEGAKKIFSASITIHIAVALLFVLLAESIGLWFLNNYINIPFGRENAANWVYQFTIITTVVNIIRAPYNSTIIAYEKMSFYAYISIIEAALRLGIVFLIYLFLDRLIAYSALVTAVTAAVLVMYVIYCRIKFPICKYKFEYNKKVYLPLVNFSGWSLFGAAANVGANQGINIILNMFFGVAVNAAMGIAHQVNAALYQFVSNFQTAFNPQIIKSYAAGDKDYFFNLILNTSRYSFYLLFLLAFPVVLCCNEIIRLWLGEIPLHSVEFCRLIIVFSLIDALQGPLWVSVQATGNIRNYQILMSVLILSNLPVTYFIFKLISIPELALVVRVMINVVTFVARIMYLKRLCDFPVKKYLSYVLLKSLFVVIISMPIPIFFYFVIESELLKLILTIILCLVLTLFSIYCLGINKGEKIFVKGLIKKKLHLI